MSSQNEKSNQPNLASEQLARLEKLQASIDALTLTLQQQGEVKKRYRRTLSIRAVLVLIALFAIISAGFGKVYRDAKRQAQAVDVLLDHQAKFQFQSRNNLFMALLPGDPDDPPRALRRVLGEDFVTEVSELSVNVANPNSRLAILRALTKLPTTRGLIISGRIRTQELKFLDSMTELESLSLSRTTLDAGGIQPLLNTRIRWLDASHTQLSDTGVFYVAQCNELQYLNLERTAISNQGLSYIAQLSDLRFLNIRRTPVSLPAVLALSKALPNCKITWQPLRFKADGQVDLNAATGGTVNLGTPSTADPRTSKSARPPFNNSQQRFGNYRLSAF